MHTHRESGQVRDKKIIFLTIVDSLAFASHKIVEHYVLSWLDALRKSLDYHLLLLFKLKALKRRRVPLDIFQFCHSEFDYNQNVR